MKGALTKQERICIYKWTRINVRQVSQKGPRDDPKGEREYIPNGEEHWETRKEHSSKSKIHFACKCKNQKNA